MRVSTCAFLAIIALTGCRLVDQTSFGGAPRAPAPGALAQALASQGAAPILVIRPDDGTQYVEQLRQAIDAAEARQPDTHFRLEAISPAAVDPNAQEAGLDATTVAARQVLDEMGVDGITPDRVALTAATDVHVTRREIRLYQG